MRSIYFYHRDILQLAKVYSTPFICNECSVFDSDKSMSQLHIDGFLGLGVAIFTKAQHHILTIFSLEIGFTNQVLSLLIIMACHLKSLMFSELLILLLCSVHYLTSQIDLNATQVRRHLELKH